MPSTADASFGERSTPWRRASTRLLASVDWTRQDQPEDLENTDGNEYTRVVKARRGWAPAGRATPKIGVEADARHYTGRGKPAAENSAQTGPGLVWSGHCGLDAWVFEGIGALWASPREPLSASIRKTVCCAESHR